MVNSLVATTDLCDVEETKVSDDHFATVNKDVFWAQVLVDNAASVQVTHALQEVTKQLIISPKIWHREKSKNTMQKDTFSQFMKIISAIPNELVHFH